MKPRRILMKMMAGSRNIRFGDFLRVIEAFGFSFERITGSHHIYSHTEMPEPISVQPDKNNQAKVYQTRQFLRLIEKYDLILRDEEKGDS
jgi:predicted RNA binding protein YcfA (HicA-like mRNA interferase family)